MTAVSRGKLSYKLLGCFLGVSLGPMSYLGYKLVNLSQDALRKETQAMQESLAVGFADTVHKYVVTFKNVLSETAGVEEFRSMEPSRQTQTLNRVLQVHLALLELSVIKPDGSELVRVGRLLPANPPLRRLGDEDYVRKGLTGTYMGKLERFQGLYPAMTIAVPIIDRGGGRAAGVLAAKVSLNGLSSMLSMEFPATGKSVAYVASKEDGFLLAHSNLGAFKPNARVEEGLLRLLLSHEEKRGGGIMSLPDGRQVLGAYADVRQDLDWIVYVEQPLETAYLAAREMKAQTFKILIWVFLVVILLSLFVSLYITQPIRMLREAAYRLGQGQFDDLPEIRMTNDEIGELAQTFLSMSESLKEKTGELITAKQELEKFTKFLEKRVEARTRELKAAQDELIKKERLAAIGQMASVVGHEIRNPLAVINNSIYFIKTKLGAAIESDGKISKHIKIIESEIQQANGIINEILTYSRTRELNPERISLNSFIEELLSSHPFPAHITIEKLLDPSNPVVDVDVTEMKQAIRNLIGNAVEVMTSSGRLRVRTGMGEAGTAFIEIADTGPGIPPDVLEKIFTPFFTTKARGTGLGLAVVRKVADRHRGRVDVESVIGKGTTFRLFLPIVQKVKV